MDILKNAATIGKVDSIFVLECKNNQNSLIEHIYKKKKGSKLQLRTNKSGIFEEKKDVYNIEGAHLEYKKKFKNKEPNDKFIFDVASALTPRSENMTSYYSEAVWRDRVYVNYYVDVLKKLSVKEIYICAAYQHYELIIAARKLGITIINVQYSSITEFHIGYYTERLPKNNPYISDRFITTLNKPKGIHKKTKITVVDFDEYKYTDKIAEGVLFISQNLIGKNLQKEALELSRCIDDKIYYKLHPNEVEFDQKLLLNGIEIIDGEENLILDPEVIVIGSSSTLLEKYANQGNRVVSIDKYFPSFVTNEKFIYSKNLVQDYPIIIGQKYMKKDQKKFTKVKFTKKDIEIENLEIVKNQNDTLKSNQKYIMQTVNDEKLLKSQIEKAINFLENNNEYDAYQGVRIFKVSSQESVIPIIIRKSEKRLNETSKKYVTKEILAVNKKNYSKLDLEVEEIKLSEKYIELHFKGNYKIEIPNVQVEKSVNLKLNVADYVLKKYIRGKLLYVIIQKNAIWIKEMHMLSEKIVLFEKNKKLEIFNPFHFKYEINGRNTFELKKFYPLEKNKYEMSLMSDHEVCNVNPKNVEYNNGKIKLSAWSEK